MSGDGPAGPVGRRPGLFLLLAAIAVVAVELSDGAPPNSAVGWLLLAVAALATGLGAAGAYQIVPKVIEWLRRHAQAIQSRHWRDWWRRHWRHLLAAVLALVLVGGGVRATVLAYDAYQFRRNGCPLPVELRVLASPGVFRAVQRVADVYESVAKDGRECPTVNVVAFPAPTAEIREAMRTGLPDGNLTRWPWPDVWIADSAIELSDVAGTPPAWMRVAPRPLPSTPLVLAVPESEVELLAPGGRRLRLVGAMGAGVRR